MHWKLVFSWLTLDQDDNGVSLCINWDVDRVCWQSVNLLLINGQIKVTIKVSIDSEMQMSVLHMICLFYASLPTRGYSLIWLIYICAAGLGMVFSLNLLNRVYNNILLASGLDMVRTYPKKVWLVVCLWGINGVLK